MLHGRWKSISTPLGYLANTRKRQQKVASVLSQARPSVSSVNAASLSSSADSVPSMNRSAASSATSVLSLGQISMASDLLRPDPASRLPFKPLSGAEWVIAKKRYTEQFQPPAASSPIAIPAARSPQELQAASTLASLVDSPNGPAVSVSPTTLDALFGDEDAFELMILD